MTTYQLHITKCKKIMTAYPLNCQYVIVPQGHGYGIAERTIQEHNIQDCNGISTLTT